MKFRMPLHAEHVAAPLQADRLYDFITTGARFDHQVAAQLAHGLVVQAVHPCERCIWEQARQAGAGFESDLVNIGIVDAAITMCDFGAHLRG